MLYRALIFSLVCVLLAGCSRKPADDQPQAKVAPAAVTLGGPTLAGQELQSPDVKDVVATVERIFGNAAVADPAPQFVAGDFNADGSVDLAVVVHPVDLETINSEVANWIREDVNRFELPPANAHVFRREQSHPSAVRFEKSEAMLAVVHGFGPAGWRNPLARQTYLLKNAVGVKLSAEDKPSFLRDGDFWNTAIRSRGQLIAETRGTTQGVVYWTGAQYAWQPAPGKKLMAAK